MNDRSRNYLFRKESFKELEHTVSEFLTNTFWFEICKMGTFYYFHDAKTTIPFKQKFSKETEGKELSAVDNFKDENSFVKLGFLNIGKYRKEIILKSK